MSMANRILVSLLTVFVLSQISCGFETKCIDDLGCFSNGPPFFDIRSRPISLLPDDSRNTMFLLFTRETLNDPQILTPANESLETSLLDPSLHTKILIHGYNVQLQNDDFLFTIKDEILEYDSYNVMVVNWSASAGGAYPQAVANARVVGAEVAKFINYHIQNRGMDPGTFHVIGHSLGGQMSGYVGERVSGLGRITGLDPAGPFFYRTAPAVRLDPSDANFVDVIHTDGGMNQFQGLGTTEPLGHMDFYPNGGRNQAGCFGISTCDHFRALIYFKESISTCDYPSVQCRNYSAYLLRRCTSENSNVAQMGFHATKLDVPDGTHFYLQTSAMEPYCEA